MKSPSLWIFSSYLFSIFSLFNSGSLFLFWCVLELNMVIFIIMIYFDKSLEFLISSEVSFFYFVIQCFGSFLLLGSIYTGSSILSSSALELLVIMGLGMKVSMFPFQFWSFKISSLLSSVLLFLFLSVQKVPLLSFLFLLPSDFFYLILLLSLSWGALFLLKSLNLGLLMVSSSLYSTFWVFFIYSSSFVAFLVYYSVYAFFLFLILNVSVSYSGLEKGFLIGSYLFFLGLPPLSLFFFKIYLIEFMSNTSTLPELVFLWGSGFLALFGYGIFFFDYFISKNFLYLKNEFLLPKMSLFLSGVLPLGVFLVYWSKLCKLLSSYLK